MYRFQMPLTTILFLSFATAVFAQSSQSLFVTGTKPRASSGGFSDTDLRNIYQEDVGQGFTSTSLNQLSLLNARARVGNFGQASAQPNTTLTSSRIPTLNPSRASKPFSSVGSSPTVSPYLNLFRTDLDGSGDFNYQTLVRPQFQQLATNQQFQRQNLEISQKVQAISAMSAYRNPAGSEQQYPTGHQTAFGYYSRFYPALQQRGR